MFQPSFESLTQFECPQWFRDAKFGIWSHWGPQSVPMVGDWYARDMYMEEKKNYHHHCRHYGHPSEFGYKDIVQLWKAEKFDPEALMDLYYKAGARYFCAQATHHDHFYNYASEINRFNSVQVGPHKDICALWQAQAKKHGIPFGLTEHLAASFSWWKVNKYADTSGPYAGVPYDGNDPAYRDFYYDNESEKIGTVGEMPYWQTPNPVFHEYWLKSVLEMIDKFQPDLLYSDGPLPFGLHSTEQHAGNPLYRTGLEAVAHLYNTSIALHGQNQALYNQKDKSPDIYKIGVRDIERSQLAEIAEDPWQTDTCTGQWFYDARATYKTAEHCAKILVDIVSKNGCLLLNIPQKPDGSIDYEMEFLLKELADWYAVVGDAIYGTRPWKTFGEGGARAPKKGFDESAAPWTESDYRFSVKGNKVYAYLMQEPESRVSVLRSFADENITSVRLLTNLGAKDIPWSFEYGVLTAKLPQDLPTKWVNTLEITVDG
jgi:alpha-L-fucosidase